jgi:hypothetical protein
MLDASGSLDSQLLRSEDSEGAAGALITPQAEGARTQWLQQDTDQCRLTLDGLDQPGFNEALAQFLQVVAPDAW